MQREVCGIRAYDAACAGRSNKVGQVCKDSPEPNQSDIKYYKLREDQIDCLEIIKKNAQDQLDSLKK